MELGNDGTEIGAPLTIEPSKGRPLLWPGLGVPELWWTQARKGSELRVFVNPGSYFPGCPNIDDSLLVSLHLIEHISCPVLVCSQITCTHLQ